MEKETKIIWKHAVSCFSLALAGFGIWCGLRFWAKPEWFRLYAVFWICICPILFFFFGWHITNFLALLVDSLFSWRRHHLQEKRELKEREREFEKKLEEIGKEYDRYFGVHRP